MAKLKLYNSATWLRKKYTDDKMAVGEIAALCGVTSRTIYYKLKEFNII